MMNSCSIEISCHAAPLPSSCTLMRSLPFFPLILVSHRLFFFLCVCVFVLSAMSLPCPLRAAVPCVVLSIRGSERDTDLHPPSSILHGAGRVRRYKAHWPSLHLHLGAADRLAPSRLVLSCLVTATAALCSRDANNTSQGNDLSKTPRKRFSPPPLPPSPLAFWMPGHSSLNMED